MACRAEADPEGAAGDRGRPLSPYGPGGPRSGGVSGPAPLRVGDLILVANRIAATRRSGSASFLDECQPPVARFPSKSGLVYRRDGKRAAAPGVIIHG